MKARLGGKQAAPWMSERGLGSGANASSTLDFLPPPGTTRLEPGDFIEATIEHIVMPQFASDYYGPSESLRAALRKDENTWRMILREAVGNDRRVEVKTGKLERLHPDIRMVADADRAAFELTGGLGYVPITFTDLTSSRPFTLTVNGEPIDQSIHGNDFWQTDYDPDSRRWSRTYNIPIADKQPRKIEFGPDS